MFSPFHAVISGCCRIHLYVKIKAQGMSEIKGRAFCSVHQIESLKLSCILTKIIIAI